MPQRKDTIYMKPFKKEMKKLKELARKEKSCWNDGRRPLIENSSNNNNNMQNGSTQTDAGYDNPSAQITLHTCEERHSQSEEHIKPQITLQELSELLCVAPDDNGSDVVGLIQRSVLQHFPKPPTDVEQNLPQHLLNVQETMHRELMRLGPLLKSKGLIECYHHQTFEHLNALLQDISSSKNSFELMKWVLHLYLSQELLGHPDLQDMDPIKKVDLLLLTEFIARAKDKLLENVQKDIKRFLEKILQIRSGKDAHNELHLDTIQCIAAMPNTAQKISPKLCDQVQEVCFQELLVFLRRYNSEQSEILQQKAKMDKPEMKPFFETLNNCKKLKQHIQTKAQDIKASLLEETVAALENMEAFTLKLLMEVVADIAKSHLKKYFKSENREFFHLIDSVQSHFSELSCFQDIQKRVMEDAYKLITHTYLQHLMQSSHSKLTRCWSPDVGQRVAKDAEILHDTILYLAPGVRQKNLMLLRVKELLECRSMEATMITVGSIQEECCTSREDLELLPALMRWKGLSRWQVREVQSALEGLPGYQPRPRSVSWYSCIW